MEETKKRKTSPEKQLRDSRESQANGVFAKERYGEGNWAKDSAALVVELFHSRVESAGLA